MLKNAGFAWLSILSKLIAFTNQTIYCSVFDTSIFSMHEIAVQLFQIASKHRGTKINLLKTKLEECKAWLEYAGYCAKRISCDAGAMKRFLMGIHNTPFT